MHEKWKINWGGFSDISSPSINEKLVSCKLGDFQWWKLTLNYSENECKVLNLLLDCVISTGRLLQLPVIHAN